MLIVIGDECFFFFHNCFGMKTVFFFNLVPCDITRLDINSFVTLQTLELRLLLSGHFNDHLTFKSEKQIISLFYWYFITLYDFYCRMYIFFYRFGIKGVVTPVTGRKIYFEVGKFLITDFRRFALALMCRLYQIFILKNDPLCLFPHLRPLECRRCMCTWPPKHKRLAKRNKINNVQLTRANIIHAPRFVLKNYYFCEA